MNLSKFKIPKALKIYADVCILFIALFGIFVWPVPVLVSAPSTISVFLGLFMTAGILAFIYHYAIKIFTTEYKG